METATRTVVLNSRNIDSYLHISWNKLYCINIIITVIIITMGCVKTCSHESKDDFDVIITVLVVLNLVSLNSNKMLIVTPFHFFWVILPFLLEFLYLCKIRSFYRDVIEDCGFLEGYALLLVKWFLNQWRWRQPSLQNFGNHLPSDAASHFRGMESSIVIYFQLYSYHSAFAWC